MGKQIQSNYHDEGVCAGNDGKVAGCLSGTEDQWLVPAGSSLQLPQGRFRIRSHPVALVLAA